jgi:peptidoglycan hydrolase-like protein with peptidoglycan-binding domain
MKPPRVPLTVDGRCGPKTESIIADFQKVVLGTARPDGRVDPSGGTIRALNDTASEGKWAQMTMAPPATGGGGGGGSSAITYPPSISASERKAIDNLAAAARAQSDKIYLQVLDMMIKSGTYGHFKNAMTVLGAGQYAGEFINAIRGMRQIGLTAEDIVWVFQQFAVAKNGNGLAELLGIMKTRPTLGASVGRLAKLGKAMNVVAVVFCVSEVANHIDAGRYGPAAAEIYGTGMSMAVPWAGFIDAFQGVAFAYAPGLKTSPGAAMFFKILNSLNPVGMGKTGIDAMVTLIDAAFRGVRERKFPMSALEGFVNRARSSPMQPFVEFGDYLGDKAADRWGQAFYETFLK